MNKSVMPAVFAVGLAAVGWVGWGFVGTSPLALAMTAVIGAVYVLGAYELRQFRAATQSLARALADSAATPTPLADLDSWLAAWRPRCATPCASASKANAWHCPAQPSRPTWWACWSCWACWAPFSAW